MIASPTSKAAITTDRTIPANLTLIFVANFTPADHKILPLSQCLPSLALAHGMEETEEKGGMSTKFKNRDFEPFRTLFAAASLS